MMLQMTDEHAALLRRRLREIEEMAKALVQGYGEPKSTGTMIGAKASVLLELVPFNPDLEGAEVHPTGRRVELPEGYRPMNGTHP